MVRGAGGGRIVLECLHDTLPGGAGRRSGYEGRKLYSSAIPENALDGH